jgi:hypothetical protein
MADLCFFKRDHSTDPSLSADQLIALPQPYDLLTGAPDTHIWSTAELTDPWFRIVAWPELPWPLPAYVQKFLASQIPGKAQASIKVRYRGSYLNLNHATIPAALKTWWVDDTRAKPILTIGVDTPGLALPQNVMTVIGVDRPAVPI